MALTSLDWIIIIVFLLITLGIGIYYKSKADKNIGEFFLGGRNMPWYIAGISMVATTFAADTPLLITEIVSKNGISSNWLWWNMLIGGLLTTFFFARLWRRAGVLTELEFLELRYSGKSAAFLRGFKAIYLGLFLNAIVIAWVNFALMKILQIFFDIPENQLIYYVAIAMVITAIYSSMSGLWGVMITDNFQFGIAMAGSIILAVIVVNSPEIGGIDQLKSNLQPEALNFFPSFGDGSSNSNLLNISVYTFFSFIGIQWWASWYPGAEPGGGGYVAQRMMSAKDEKNAFLATLFFQIAHYCIRPWPWIIVALCTTLLYPELSDNNKSAGYVMAMKDFLPSGLKGLLLVGFLSAYMSTISTQLNWGASFVVNDFYQRFFVKTQKDSEENNQKQVRAARIATILIMLISILITTQISSIEMAWKIILGAGAGLGLVLILRWYWWKVSAWSEIVATFAPLVAYCFSYFVLEDYFGTEFSENNGSFFFTVAFTTIIWISYTLLFPQKIDNHLIAFYSQIKPAGFWKPLVEKTKIEAQEQNLKALFYMWIVSMIMVYSALFLSGKILFKEWDSVIYLSIVFIISTFLVVRGINKMKF
jgi:solute:Na+ symporter, SSS family